MKSTKNRTRNLENRILNVEKKIQKDLKISSTKNKRGNARLRNRGSRGLNYGFNPMNNSGQSLNAMQLNSVNPNVFWEFSRGSTPGGLRIKAREPVGSVTLTSTSTGAFQVLTWPSTGALYLSLNSDSVNFPRLSNISLAFEMFIFHTVRMDFISTQPTTASGQIILWADYNADDSVATTSSEALSNISSVISNVYSAASMGIDKKLSRLPKYFCNSSSGTIVQTNQANVFAGVQGFNGNAGAALGEIMIEYDVEFFTPSQQVGTVLKDGESFLSDVKKEFASMDDECGDKYWKAVCSVARKRKTFHRIKFLDEPLRPQPQPISGRGTLRRETSVTKVYRVDPEPCPDGRDCTSCTQSFCEQKHN